VSNVTFEAVFKQVPYPQPRQLWLSGFNGSIGFSAENATQAEWIVYQGRIPKERCRGAEEWDDCGVTDVSLGELERVQQENQRLRQESSQERRHKYYSWIALVLIVLVLVRKRQIEGRYVAYHGVPKKHYERGLIRSRKEVEAEKNDRNLISRLFSLFGGL